jgi:putative glycosyltransferase (TIGR04372 family)
MKQKIKQFLKIILWFYEYRIALFVALYVKWLYFPLYYYCKKKKICFVVNVASSTGHITCEMDYFFRRIYAKKIDLSKKYVMVRPSDRFSKTMLKLYGNNFHWSCTSYVIYEILLPLVMAYPDITIDSGLSRLKWQPIKKMKLLDIPYKQFYIDQLPKKDNFNNWSKFYCLRNETRDLYPLNTNKLQSQALEKFVSLKGKKCALLHLKESLGNATAMPTDPKTYIDALTYLKDHNYKLVFVGRERMPQIFKSFDVLNYARSNLANFFHDLCLAKMSDISIVGGSGIAFLPDCLGKYFLTVNSWHLSLAQASHQSIFVPSLVMQQDKLISFKRQLELYIELPDLGPELFPKKNYGVRNATSDEILEGVKEVLALQKKEKELTALQNRFKTMEQNVPLAYAGARPSEYFLKKHEKLF